MHAGYEQLTNDIMNKTCSRCRSLLAVIWHRDSQDYAIQCDCGVGKAQLVKASDRVTEIYANLLRSDLRSKQTPMTDDELDQARLDLFGK